MKATNWEEVKSRPWSWRARWGGRLQLGSTGMQAQGSKTHSGHFPCRGEDVASAAGLGRGRQDRMGLGAACEVFSARD